MDLSDILTGGEPIEVEVRFNMTDVAIIAVALAVAIFAGVWAGVKFS